MEESDLGKCIQINFSAIQQQIKLKKAPLTNNLSLSFAPNYSCFRIVLKQQVLAQHTRLKGNLTV